MNKNILFVLIVFILVAAGIYLAFFYKSDTILTKDIAFVLLTDIAQQTKINFSNMQAETIVWSTESESGIGSTVIAGKTYSAIGISNDDADKIKQYFEDRGWRIDFFDINKSTLAGTSGYIKDNKVCTIETVVEDKDFTKLDVDVSCGEL